MPHYENRLYEPSDDPRAFDGGDDEFNEDEGSRLPLLIVIALVVLASFAGVVWIAYTQGVQRGRENAPFIHAAEQGRAVGDKQRDNPYAKLEIYKPVKPEGAASPPPPAILPKSTPATPRTGGSPQSGINARSANSPQPAPIGGSTAKSLTSAPKATPPITKEAPKSAAPALKQTPAATGSPRSITPAATQPNAGQAAASSSAPRQLPVSPAAVPLTEPSGSGAQGDYVLQIGSYPSASEANASWQSYKAAHPSVAGYASNVQTADLGKRGTWYRLRIGPFASLAEAGAACAKLKAQGSSCLPAKR